VRSTIEIVTEVEVEETEDLHTGMKEREAIMIDQAQVTGIEKDTTEYSDLRNDLAEMILDLTLYKHKPTSPVQYCHAMHYFLFLSVFC